jgi:hypothetical protein
LVFCSPIAHCHLFQSRSSTEAILRIDEAYGGTAAWDRGTLSYSHVHLHEDDR